MFNCSCSTVVHQVWALKQNDRRLNLIIKTKARHPPTHTPMSIRDCQSSITLPHHEDQPSFIPRDLIKLWILGNKFWAPEHEHFLMQTLSLSINSLLIPFYINKYIYSRLLPIQSSAHVREGQLSFFFF